MASHPAGSARSRPTPLDRAGGRPRLNRGLPDLLSDRESGRQLDSVPPLISEKRLGQQTISSARILGAVSVCHDSTPFPTKPRVLAAGVTRTRLAVFLTALLSGRLLGYAAMGYLGYRFGDEAARKIPGQYPVMLPARSLLRSLRAR